MGGCAAPPTQRAGPVLATAATPPVAELAGAQLEGRRTSTESCAAMDDPLLGHSDDLPLLEELELLTDLIIASTSSTSRLSDQEIDEVLGVQVPRGRWSSAEWRPGGRGSRRLPTIDRRDDLGSSRASG